MTGRRNSGRMRWLVAPIAGALAVASCSSSGNKETSVVAPASSVAESTATSSAGTETSTAGTAPGSTTSATTASTTAGGLTPVPSGLDLDASVKMAFSVAPNQLDP